MKVSSKAIPISLEHQSTLHKKDSDHFFADEAFDFSVLVVEALGFAGEGPSGYLEFAGGRPDCDFDSSGGHSTDGSFVLAPEPSAEAAPSTAASGGGSNSKSCNAQQATE
jgi:hypothetical protein